MGRPPKDPTIPGEYTARAKAWLVCSRCDRSIPYQGKPDPQAGDGWPQHRCLNGKVGAFTRYTTDNPIPPPVTPTWDELTEADKTKPDVMIG